MNFGDLVGARYGNPNAVFLAKGDEVEVGTKVKVMPTNNSSDALWDGVIVKHKKKKIAARVKVNGRTWFLPVDRHQVLVKW